MKIKTTKLVALRNIYYDGDRKTGEEFDVQEEHVLPLIRVGAAKPVDDKPGSYRRRDLRAEE
jgi:hypothetical protein